jgi:amino acid transporter
MSSLESACGGSRRLRATALLSRHLVRGLAVPLYSLALFVIELSSRYPAEGGFYVWTKKAFGEGAGFLSAWMYWVSNLPYFPAVLYFAGSNVLFLHPSLQRFSQKPAYFIAFSVFFLVVLTILNILGLNLASGPTI